MATLLTDRDGKSKTASAVDAKHYPEQNEVPSEHSREHHQEPTPVSNDVDSEKIQLRAYELWCERGYPHGSAEQDWHQAEQELRTKSGSERISDKQHEGTGSVQR